MHPFIKWLIDKETEATSKDRRHFVITSRQLGKWGWKVPPRYATFSYKRGDTTYICIMF